VPHLLLEPLVPSLCAHQDGLTITYKWIQTQLEKEKAAGSDTNAYASSKIVGTSAPSATGLPALR